MAIWMVNLQFSDTPIITSRCLPDSIASDSLHWLVKSHLKIVKHHMVNLNLYFFSLKSQFPLGKKHTMDWFKGKFTPESPMILMGKSMVSCRFSRKPIHFPRSLWTPWTFCGDLLTQDLTVLVART